MHPNGVRGYGISAPHPKSDLSDLPAILDRVEALGVETIELPTFDMDLIVGGRIQKGHLALLKRACAGRKVAYTVHGPLAINFFDDPARLPRHFEVMKASLEIAAEVGAIHYIVHSGMMPNAPQEVVEAAYGRQRDWLAKIGDVAKQLDLLVCVETMFGGHEGRKHASLPSRLAQELSEIGHANVWATFDFSHSFLRMGYFGGDFLKEAEALAPFAKHLHIHDSFGLADVIDTHSLSEKLAFGHGDLHLPVGWGEIPWDELMSRCIFPDGVVFDIELNQRYWYAVEECVAATRDLALRARTSGLRKSA